MRFFCLKEALKFLFFRHAKLTFFTAEYFYNVLSP